MNRRQFLTGASAIAASAALPKPVLAIDFGSGPSVSMRWVFFDDKFYWITGEDNVIHWFDPHDVEIA